MGEHEQGSGDPETSRTETITASSSTADDSAGAVVAIPAYNEAATIGSLVERTRRHVDDVIVVDDGSDDETAKRASEAGAIVIQNEETHGYGAALRTAFREASRWDVDHLVVIHGDGHHDPDDVPLLLATQRETGAELVIANSSSDELERPTSTVRRIGRWLENLVTNLYLGTHRRTDRVTGIQSEFRAYGRELVRSLANDDALASSGNVGATILFYARHRDYPIELVDINGAGSEVKTSTLDYVVTY